ncbi:Ribosomal small subunit pseudouridine synthase A [Enhygromyxa salina]|uniref:Ribosomal small subunit pseudouridine synthase A n=1 Tax=Enhygromyxa salina TaxID=215803 RepID=A0A0C2CUW8_9BACT|nr:pseudouridine synthase [Enhygromyxa salina]KIG14921.1 Ribosomal small subunit pseudouridine synthase A [Enhygromyxa salina]
MPRLDQLLARNLGQSRREVTRLLRRGAVAGPGGERLRDGRLAIATTQLPFEVEVSGVVLQLRLHVHLIQHKPVGVVTSRNDDRHPTAWGLLEGAPMHAELRAIGRLDLDAAGLLLWTTDTPQVHALTHPNRAVPRSYQVALARPWTPAPLGPTGSPELRLADGSRPRITELGPLLERDLHPALQPPPGTGALAQITLLDGAYHEVKRIFAALDSHVLLLVRVAHAGLWLPETLEAGAWRELTSLPGGGP